MSRWTKEEIEFLKDNYFINGSSFCAEHLGKTIEAVRIKANRCGFSCDIDQRYNRVKTPIGYYYCYSCCQTLEEGKFYKKSKQGKYGQKSSLCRACNQDKARRTYRKHSSSTRLRTLKNPIHKMYMNIKGRAKKNNIPFNIEESDIIIPEKCPVLNIDIIPFSNSDNSPSIDRFNPELGYIKGNIYVISKRANRIKSNASIEEVKMLYDWMLTKYVSSRKENAL